MILSLQSLILISHTLKLIFQLCHLFLTLLRLQVTLKHLLSQLLNR